MRARICVDSWQALNSVGMDLNGLGVAPPIWTRVIQSRLCRAGQALKYYVCTSGVAQANRGEWLFDQVWMNWTHNTPRQLERISLAVECEWDRKWDEIFYDFEKLLVARADVRLMIFQATDAQSVHVLFDLLRHKTHGLTQHQSDDYYMLAGYDMAEGRFLRDGFRINDTLAMENVPFLSRDR